MVNWLEALRIGGQAFLTVFIVLGVLSLVLWLVSIILQRVLEKTSKAEAKSEN